MAAKLSSVLPESVLRQGGHLVDCADFRISSQSSTSTQLGLVLKKKCMRKTDDFAKGTGSESDSYFRISINDTGTVTPSSETHIGL